MNKELENEWASLSPLDGRYTSKTKNLRVFFSEFSLIKYRISIECDYLVAFLGITKLATKDEVHKISVLCKKIIIGFDKKEMYRIKLIEKETQHDVKAVELYVKEKLKQFRFINYLQFIHFGLTSEDVNNIAYALALQNTKDGIVIPLLNTVIKTLDSLGTRYKKSVMIARTHGQLAVPTTFGKEMYTYSYRLRRELRKIHSHTFSAKMNGAVGNNNALWYLFPSIQWDYFFEQFIKQKKLDPFLFTSQILPYDNWIEYFQMIYRVNGILGNFCQDMWIYILLRLITQKNILSETGSSTMPQKINPIQFENAEGNFVLANGLLETFQRKLFFSRLQRDLSDSTIRRSFGSALGYMVIGLKSVLQGLERIAFDDTTAKKELEVNWQVLAEAVQLYLRKKGKEEAFNHVKKSMKGARMTKTEFLSMLKKMGKTATSDLDKLSPEIYIGSAARDLAS